MSRCFPYPPPEYSGIEGSNEALIESIKLQRERDLVKAIAKKDRKREKKERRKEKKEKSKTGLLPEKKIHKLNATGLINDSLLKLLQSENEQLERSSLTEERALRASEQKPSTSSDSTSSKRKREASPPAVVKQEGNSIRGSGNVIRIRLSSKRQNALISRQEPCSTTPTPERTLLPPQTQNALISRQEPCSTSGRTHVVPSNKHREGQVDVPSIELGNNNVISVRPPRPEADRVCSATVPELVTSVGNAAAVSQFPENELPLLPPRPDREVASSLGGPKVTTREDDLPVRDPKSLNKKLVKAELRYRDLFLNWVPPPPQTELEPDDQDWLFDKKKNPDNQSEKKLKSSNNVSCGNSSSLWPCAQFIPEADIYALPYTVPF
ncbi:hypothetical protein LIER_01628 [Lithospermum erythrorhizon]|uniref:Uncharacterized protein n=1 Tax=Lithospermum erythrorhizon TaxID=34254 RepID=A0AAV3NLP7_LITER